MIKNPAIKYLIFLLLCPTGIMRAQSNGPIALSEIGEEGVSVGGSFHYFLDYENKATIQDLLELDKANFLEASEVKASGQPVTVWAYGILKNNTGHALRLYLEGCQNPEEIWVYEIEQGQVMDSFRAGKDQPLSERALPSFINYVPLNLDVGQSKTLLIKNKFDGLVGAGHLTEAHLFKAENINHEFFQKVSWQLFYAGLMLLLAVFSWLISVLFRNRTFVFYGFLMFFFVLYFLATHNLAQVSLGFTHLLSRVEIINLSLSGILVFGYFFVSRFINLPQKLPVINRIYLATSFLASISVLLTLYASQKWALASNAVIGLWVIFTFLATVLVIRKGMAEGRVLLFSILLITSGGLLYIFELVGLFSLNNWGLYGFQIGTVAFSFTLFYALVKGIGDIRNEKRQVLEIDRLKSKFFENISHEFRTPLTLIMGPVQKVAEGLKDSEDKKLLQNAHKNSQRLLNLINQILELTKLEASQLKLYLSKENIVSLLRSITGSFESLAVKQDISFDFHSEIDELTIWADQEKLQKIMNNLLSNAFKFTGSGGAISVKVWEQEEMLNVSVQDTGCGIPAGQLPHIFNRFFQADSGNNRQGAGIGLALAKELVELHKGNISVESEPGAGTIFTFQLPKNKSVYRQEDFIDEGSILGKTVQADIKNVQESDDAHEAVELSDLLGQYEQQRLLVIEDNDDVRHYITGHLKKNFNIIEARNGVEGIDLALKTSPDLIICDVMMPLKNGYEVVSAVKSDVRTSHIPIIMLTAMAGKEDRIKGLEMGADDYLLKPFDTDELETRVANLIKQRHLLQEKFSASGLLETETATLNSLDQKFVKDLNQLLSDHYADPKLGVEKLARETGMSQTSLNRKLNSLLGTSPNKLIQDYRLQQAKNLLHQKQGNTSEIAYLTGFSSSSYFVKCFREKYGVTPGSLLED